MMLTGEPSYIGGRTMYIGGAAMPLGSEPFGYDPRKRGGTRSHGASLGERQKNSMKAMHAAFHRKYGEGSEIAVDPMTETYLI